ncbi:MAG TPA: universal stress protein [Cytophagaceae bacterium]|jgi:nucleotide-binding universal stress UspA family protein|nr:universal stress protein [Cytophagaceae bacterium]
MKINTILFLTDFSGNAANAFYYTLNFAKKVKASITVLHTYHLPIVGVPIVGAEVPLDSIERQIEFSERIEKEHIEDLLKQAKLLAPDVICAYLIKEGSVTSSISEIIKNENIDIIFMGTKGAGKLASILFGTVTGKVIEKASCPVFIVPDHASYSPLKNILYGSDYEKSDFSVLNNIADLAEIFDGEITIANVCDQEDNIGNVLLERFEILVRKNISFQNLKFISIIDKDVVHAIDQYAEEKNIDLIVMNSHKRTLFQKIYDRSLTKKLSYQTHIPLLAYHTNGIG